MTDEKWTMLVEQAKQNFEDVSLYTEDLVIDTQDGSYKQGTQDILEFTNPGGHFKVIRETKPVVLEKKEYFSHRQGDSARTEYTFSETEFTNRVRFFKENLNGDWEELSADALGL